MAINNYHIPAYAQLKSVTQEVQQATLPPTSLQQAQVNYLLDKLQEEAAEVIQAVSKIRRFGENNSHPDRQTTNKQELVTELEDLLAILAALEHAQYLDPKPSQPNIQLKTLELLR